MLKWLSKMFEKMCSVCVIMNFVIGGAVGGTIGGITENALFCLFCFIGGLIIASFINVMSFGFLAQIIEIRKKVDLLEQIIEIRDEEDLLAKSSNVANKVKE